MVLEYTAASALAELRQFAQPSTLGTTAISLGLEDHASFAWLGALALQDCLDAVRSVLSCELVAALRAARRRVALDTPLGPSSALRRLVDHCAQVPDDGEDHALVEDLATAGALLAQPWPVG
jgi:histidine ammonia-lyase